MERGRSIEGRVEYDKTPEIEPSDKIVVDYYPDNNIIVIYGRDSILKFISQWKNSVLIGCFLFSFPGAMVYSIKIKVVWPREELLEISKETRIDLVWNTK